MGNDTEIVEAVAERLRDELAVELKQQLSAVIIEQLFALNATEDNVRGNLPQKSALTT